MADRFDKFTERARRVLTLAQEEAQLFRHNYAPAAGAGPGE
jgi:ATP-dependent Clp protease ATP-binding subunit ClpC